MEEEDSQQMIADSQMEGEMDDMEGMDPMEGYGDEDMDGMEGDEHYGEE